MKTNILYKYRSWYDKNHKKCLTQNELYFAAPDDLNDPFDFKISTMDISQIDSQEKISEFIEIIYNKSSEVIRRTMDKEKLQRNFTKTWLNPNEFS